MQFKLSFKLRSPLTLPLSYHGILQGFIYNVLRETPEYSQFLHDEGYSSEEHNFKLFVFSVIKGEYKVQFPQITFYTQISFEVRSPIDEFCMIFFHALMNQESFQLNRNSMDLISCEARNYKIKKDHLRIRMVSPMCVYTTYYNEDNSKKTHYYSPEDDEFVEYANHNLYSKYLAMHGYYPDLSIDIKPLHVNPRSKYVTKFQKDILITAWNGDYELVGEPDVLQFLYDSGLGSRNSQGFGMFDIL